MDMVRQNNMGGNFGDQNSALNDSSDDDVQAGNNNHGWGAGGPPNQQQQPYNPSGMSKQSVVDWNNQEHHNKEIIWVSMKCRIDKIRDIKDLDKHRITIQSRTT